MKIDKTDRDYINHLPEGTFIEHNGKMCIVVTDRKIDKRRKKDGKRDRGVQDHSHRGQ